MEINIICYNVFAHLTVDGYLDTFQLGSIMTSASMKLLVNAVHLVNRTASCLCGTCASRVAGS